MRRLPIRRAALASNDARAAPSGADEYSRIPFRRTPQLTRYVRVVQSRGTHDALALHLRHVTDDAAKARRRRSSLATSSVSHDVPVDTCA